MNLLRRVLGRVSTLPTGGGGCGLILFMSGLVVLSLWAAMSQGVSPA